jgi:hypothetical protein
MKKITLLNYALSTILFLVLVSNVNAQLQNANWYFGIHAALNFNDGTLPPTILTDNPLIIPNASATVSDELGNLLFYTDGVDVYNKNHTIMLNGATLNGTAESSTVLIIPVPFESNKYYIFTTEFIPTFGGGLSYSIVDMTQDGGLGEVIVKDNILLAQVSQKIAVTKSTTDDFYWLVALAPSTDPIFNDTFYSFKIDASGINLINQTAVTFAPGLHNSEGQMKISPDNQNIGLVHNTIDLNTGIIKTIFTFDFDETTGSISNQKSSFGLDNSYINYGLEFSPDSNLMYVTETNDLIGSSGKIYQIQYRTLSPELTTTVIYDNFSSETIYALQRRDNGKIYAATDSDLIGVINNPNELGINSNHVFDGINFGPFNTETFEISPNKGLPHLVPNIISIPKLSINYNTSYANDTITKLKAKDTGVVVFGEIGADNVDNLPGLAPGFIAEYDNGGTLLNSDTQQLPYQIPLDLQENTFKWDLLSTNTSLNGGVNNNYKLSKFNNDNSIQFEITTVNINEDLLEDSTTGNTYLVFPASTDLDVSIVGSSGVMWTRSATQQQDIQDGTIFTKTLNLAKFDSSGVLISVSELLNYKWSRTTTGGTALVNFPAKIVGDNTTIYFTTASRDEGLFTDATKIYLTNGEFHKKGEWLISYNVSNHTFKQAKLIGQNGSITSNELIFSQSTLYRKRKKKLFKLDQNLNDIDSLVMLKLKVLESNKIAGTFIIRGDNKRTIKKIDANFNELWSKNLGQKFEITHASEAPNGDVYVSGSYIEDATLSNPDNTSLLHNTGTDVFITKVDGLPITAPPMANAKTIVNQQNRTEVAPKNSIVNEFIVYPNPFNENISIKSNKESNFIVEIYNMTGKLVSKQKADNSDFKLKTSNLKKGMYYLRIIDSSSRSIIKKVIKN